MPVSDSFSLLESLRVDKLPTNELVWNREPVENNSSIFKHRLDILYFFILEKVGENLLADKFVGHNSEHLTEKSDFWRIRLNMLEETFELSDRDDFVFFIFDSLKKFFDHLKIPEEPEKTLLVLFEIAKNSLGVVFGNIFCIFIGFFGIVGLPFGSIFGRKLLEIFFCLVNLH